MHTQETFANDHRVVNQKGQNKGRFTFTAADSGEHRICFLATNPSSGGSWFGHPEGVRLHLDLAVGDTSEIESKDKDKINDLVQRVKDLNARLHDIKREQVFQRVCCSIYSLFETVLIVTFRIGRPISVINPSLLMPVLFAGQ